MNRRPSSSKWPTSPDDSSPSIHVLAAAAGVALERHLVADEDAPGLALGDLALALVVDDLHHRPARRPAGGPGGGPQVLRGGDRRPGDLGRAVEVVEVVAEVVHPLGRQRPRERRAARRGDPQRREVVPGERLLRQLEDPLHHHRDDDQRRGAGLGDRLQRRLGVELAPEHVGRVQRRARARSGRSPRSERAAPRSRCARRRAAGSSRTSPRAGRACRARRAGRPSAFRSSPRSG